MKKILSVENLTRSFGGINALISFDFEIRQGEIRAIIGPNGAGKTTFFNLISGLFLPTKGKISYKDRQISNLSTYERTLLGIGRTFQNIRLFKNMNVIENVMLARHCRTNAGLLSIFLRPPFKKSAEHEKSREIGKSLLDFVGLSDKSEMMADNLPYGEQRKLEIARALATDPQLLLLDEPAAGMNPEEVDELQKLIQRIRSLNKTILLIEHNMDFVMTISDAVAVLNFGKKIAEGRPSEIQNNPLVIEAYIGSED